MGFFWAGTSSASTSARTSTGTGEAVCPMRAADSETPTCPMRAPGGESSGINPLNNMPHHLLSGPAPGQTTALPTERTLSTIPRGDDLGKVWEYPLPQQMLNAMLRRGKDPVPEDAVELMVDVHNFLNEEAWQEILEWENRHTTDVGPRLLRFTGRPHDLLPKARLHLALAKVFPSTFSSEPPFDRHDWTVLRHEGTGWREVRYVIDYYGGPEEDDMPTFFLDVRPGLDSVGAAMDRIKRCGEESKPVFWKAMGWGAPPAPLE